MVYEHAWHDLVRRDKQAGKKVAQLEDVMEQPLAADIPKSVELGSSSSIGKGSSGGASAGGSGLPSTAPPRQRGTLHDRQMSDTDVILDLESPAKASRRSSLRLVGAQVSSCSPR